MFPSSIPSLVDNQSVTVIKCGHADIMGDGGGLMNEWTNEHGIRYLVAKKTLHRKIFETKKIHDLSVTSYLQSSFWDPVNKTKELLSEMDNRLAAWLATDSSLPPFSLAWLHLQVSSHHYMSINRRHGTLTRHVRSGTCCMCQTRNRGQKNLGA